MKNKHKKILKHAKGYMGRAKNCFRVAIRRVHRAWQNEYKSRRLHRRDFRKQCITSINAGVREHGMPYNKFMFALGQGNIALNRRVLAELAQKEPFSFRAVVATAMRIHPYPRIGEGIFDAQRAAEAAAKPLPLPFQKPIEAESDAR